MKHMRKICAFLLTLSFLCALLVFPSSALEVNSQVADSVLQLGESTSLQYALIDGDSVKVSGHAGVYSKTENRALTNENMYGIGSVSKIYTTAAVMKLVESGKLSLDTPVIKYLPEFKMADPRYKTITVRMLLNHSSGLWGSSLGSGFLFEDSSSTAKDELLDRLQNQKLKADPGAYSVYCNDGFTLAEILVEKISGKDFTSFLHENFTEPLGLNHTFSPQDNFDTSLLAKTYHAGRESALPNETTGVIGTGGIYASAEDLALFGSIFILTASYHKNQFRP